MPSRKIDIAILGGGLAGGLIALALTKLRPQLNLALFERGPNFGGNHVWSYFASDVAADDAWLVEPMIAARWANYDVRFPKFSRTLTTPYRSCTSELLDEAVRAALPVEALMTNAAVTAATQTSVTLADGQVFNVGGVIDARGASGLPHLLGGWQKFAGQMLRMEQPHGLARPIVMDATVAQEDGYRFVYCLPFSEYEVFVEDTYYADTAALDLVRLRSNIADYCAAQGWAIAEILREEAGVLPVIGAGDFARFWGDDATAPARAGVRAALVHPLTSYSLPQAVRFAAHITTLRDVSGAALARASYAWARAHWQRGRYDRMLTTMLFGAARPEQRYRVLQRFYGLSQGLVERFYAGRMTLADRARVLIGQPPVPIAAALKSLARKGRPLAKLENSQ